MTEKKDSEFWSQQKKNTAKRVTLSAVYFAKIVGIFFILLATAIVLVKNCLSSGNLFVVYALIGIGIALILTRSAARTSARIKAWNISVGLFGGVALPFILFFTNPVGKFKEDQCGNIVSLTVFVHGKKGVQDMVLRQQGFVIMDVPGGERKRASINENGAANFQNLRLGDLVKINVDFSEPYRSVYPDSNYIVTLDGTIYLLVELQGIGKVEGKVIYEDAPMENVQVQIGDLLDTTNASGQFSFKIPDSLQQKEYTVWVSKKGFRMISKPVFPQTGQSLIIVMEK